MNQAGWVVLDYDGRPKPDVWATEDEATEKGLAGKYLLSGFEAVPVPCPCTRDADRGGSNGSS